MVSIMSSIYSSLYLIIAKPWKTLNRSNYMV